MSLTKSKIKLLFNNLYNNIHFIVFGIVLLAISYKNVYLIILLLIYLIILFIKNKPIFIYTLIILLLIISVFMIKEINYNIIKEDIIVGKVVKVEKINESLYKHKIKTNNRYYLVNIENEYSVGSILKLKGKLDSFDVHYPSGFDYNNYLHYQNIKGVILLEECSFLKKGFSLHYFNYLINNYIDNSFDESIAPYLKTLIIGNSDSLDTTNINKIGISHLFVVSGLHVNIIILIIGKILSLFKLKNQTSNIITFIFSTIYVVIVGFMISIIRVWISLLLKLIVKNKLTKVDIISLNIIIVLIINPYYIYNYSFILSYLIAFFMLIYEDILKLKNRFLNRIINMFILTFIIQLLTLPITITMNPDFNLVSCIINPFFIYFVTYLFLPLSFITLIFKFIWPIYSYIVIVFEYLVDFFSNFEFLIVSLGNINVYFKIVYYLIFYFVLYHIYNKKYLSILIFLIIMFIWYYKGLFNLTNKIYFLDLPVGEATLIVSKNNHEVILIDSGEITKNHDMTNILKHLGIKKIDYLIISHSDTDHIGGAFDIVKYIKVKNIVFNKYDVNSKTNYFHSFGKVIYLKSNDIIKEENFMIKVLSPNKDYHNVNDNSLVFILNVFNISILFTGDISLKIEEEILKNYSNINVDFYKVAHHGSSTSSSIKFISNIKFKYAVIMSGYYNTFGFPKNEIVNRFKKEKLLTTKEFNTIQINVKKNKYKLILFKK